MLRFESRNFILLSFLIIILNQCPAQEIPDTVIINNYKTAVKTQADSMIFWLQTNQFEKYIHVHHPGLIKALGGEKNLQAELTKSFVTRGMQVISYVNNIPEKFIISESNIQCVFSQIQLMKLNFKKVEISSTIIAISYDIGKTWYFINTGGMSRELLKQILPEINDGLIIPPQKTVSRE